MKEVYELRVGDYKVVSDSGVIKTAGVGSCMVICLYDKQNKIGAMSHCMLPDRTSTDNSSEIGKYIAETIPKMYEEMKRKGANSENIKAKLVGGASMFSIFDHNKIGENNLTKAHEVLKDLKIPIKEEATGGSTGRRVSFDIYNGLVEVISTI